MTTATNDASVSSRPRGSQPFLLRFMAAPKQVASLAPSSRWLATATCRHVDRSRPQTIVELGAGTGAITAVALRKMHPQSRLIAMELDPEFARQLARRCPAAQVVCANVLHWEQELDRLGVEKFDLLLNGLPTPSLPPVVNRAVFSGLLRRAPDAWMSQLTVMPWVYRAMYRRLFEHVRFDLVPLNIPPGGVYHCRTLRGGWDESLPGIARQRRLEAAKAVAAAE